MNQWITLEEKHGSGAYGNWPIALEMVKDLMSGIQMENNTLTLALALASPG